MSRSLATIFHISDIHIGEAKVQTADFYQIIDDIEERAKDVVAPLLLITGDLTSDGLQEEYEAFHQGVDGISIPMVIIPGNHDERNYGSAHFEKHFGNRFKTYQTEDIVIFGVDSAEPDNDAGHVGRAYYPKIEAFFERASEKIKIFALHHHLVPVPHTGREHNVVEDSGDVLGTLDGSNCTLVLNGHRHVPWLWRLNDMVLYNAGTLLSRRLRGATSQVQTQIDLMKESAVFYIRSKDGTEEKRFEASLRVT